MSGETFVLGLLALLTLLACVVLWNVFATARAKIGAAERQRYQELAERAVDAQQRATSRLDRLEERLPPPSSGAG